MKTLKIKKIFNGNYPILRIAHRNELTGKHKNNNVTIQVYEIIDIPDDISESKLLSSIDPNNIFKEKSIIRFSEI